MDIRLGDFVRLKSWEEVVEEDGKANGISKETWKDLRKELRKITTIKRDSEINLIYYTVTDSRHIPFSIPESFIKKVYRLKLVEVK